MSIYRPTYLYIKQHSITGKLYFGKTVQNPEKYKGSGLVWLRHINSHGRKYVVTLWYHLFEDQMECTEFALDFSHKMNIVESNQWLNLKPENGLDGGSVYSGRKLNEYSRKLISEGNKGKHKHPKSSSHKLKISEGNKGKHKHLIQCTKCGLFARPVNISRWHNDNCKPRYS